MVKYMKNIHIIPDEKFTAAYIKRINEYFGENENFFLVVQNKFYATVQTANNVKMVSLTRRNVLPIFMMLVKYNKIFLHNISYLNVYFFALLSLVPKVIKKQYWVIWGEDLYSYQIEKKTLKEKLVEYIRKRFIKNLKGIVFWIKGDYELAQKWYKTKAQYFVGGYTDDNKELLYDLVARKQKKDNFIRIQVGNSAALRNNHIEALKKLKQVDSSQVIIYCPLSYAGSKEYIKNVVAEGKNLFGDRFIALTEIMTKDEYTEYLNGIDIGVFNTDRQMGLGNITNLIALGKKVYINDFTTSWGFYRDRNIDIFSFNKVDFNNEECRNTFFSPLSNEQKKNNFDSIIEYKNQFKQCWENIFNS